jgi:cytidylate kinase
VRLVGTLEKRIEHLRKTQGIGKKEALALIRREDRGRQRYLKKYFGKEIGDPLSYHLILNTDCVRHERAARLIGEAATDWLGSQESFANAAIQTPAPEPIRPLLAKSA